MHTHTHTHTHTTHIQTLTCTDKRTHTDVQDDIPQQFIQLVTAAGGPQGKLGTGVGNGRHEVRTVSTIIVTFTIMT